MTIKMSKSRFPTQGSRETSLLFTYGAKKGRGPTIGSQCIGLTSGATAQVVGYYTSPDRVQVALVVNGQGGDKGIPFLPNEEIEEVGDDSKGVTLSAIAQQSGEMGTAGAPTDVDAGP